MKKIRRAKPEGPYRSQLEKRIHSIMRKRLFEGTIIRVNKKGLIEGNKRIEVDLFLPQYNLGIEIQGPIHTSSPQHISKDYIKKLKFSKVGIDLIYIYTNSTKNLNHGINKCVEIISQGKK